MHAKRSTVQWLTLTQECDFDTFALKQNREKEHRVVVKFQKNIPNCNIKEAFVVLKFFLVDYDKTDPSHQTFIEGLTQEKIQSKFLKTGVPTYVDLQPALQFIEDNKPVSQQEIVRKYAQTNMKVVF